MLACEKRCGEVIKVLLVDGHPVVRRGLKSILTEEIQGVLCGEARNRQEALDAVEGQEWDLVIMDIWLPGGDGLDVLKELKGRRPNLPVLVLSFYGEVEYGRRALMAGASGYLSKESSTEELVRSIHLVLSRHVYVSLGLGESLAKHLLRDARGPLHENLSNRELEILLLLGSGRTTTQIANDLHLAVSTISTYKNRILRKMNMKSTAELMRYVIQNELM